MKMTWIETRFGMQGTGSDRALNGRGQGRLGTASGPDDDVRLEKVAKLKAQIDAGTYAVPSEALAETLMEHMLRAGEQDQADGDL